MNTTPQSQPLRLLHSPWAIFAGMGGGVILGIYARPAIIVLGPCGRIFLSLLQMCILPILICSVISSMGKLFGTPRCLMIVKRTALVLVLGILLAGTVGAATAYFGNVGRDLSEETRSKIGLLLSDSQEASSETSTQSRLSDFFIDMVPANIFRALSEGRTLGILTFSILLGIALGVVRTDQRDGILKMLDTLYAAFQKIIEWLMYALPLGLLCIIAGQTASVGVEVFIGMGRFILFVYIGCIVLIAAFLTAVRIVHRGPLLPALAALKAPVLIALGTQSTFPSIPSALRIIHRAFHTDRDITGLLIPFGMGINRQGMIFLMAFTTVFLAQLYDMPLSVPVLIITILGSALFGMAHLGSVGMAAGVLAILLGRLGIPAEPAFVFLMVVDPIIAPIIAVTIVAANCALAIVVAPRSRPEDCGEE